MLERRLTFQCTLLEDLHAGSGVGRLKTIDDCQARDVRGRPVVWYSMVAGLLRDAADELLDLEHPLASKDRIERLFGAEGRPSRSSLVCRSLHFQPKRFSTGSDSNPAVADPGPLFVNVMSTAREVHSRRPLDQTLRTIEYAIGGLVADGEMRFQADQDGDGDEQFLKLCLKRLTALGGGRTRGAGRIHVQIHGGSQPDSTMHLATLLKPRATRRLRLVLKNLEPLCIPATAFPGNLLNTESYLPGQTLRGAFLTAICVKDLSATERKRVEAETQFTHGYFIPADLCKSSRNLETVCSIPLPLTAQEAKATELPPASQRIPWWAQPEEETDCWPRKGREEDTLWKDKDALEVPAEDPASSFKRVKSEDYLVTADGTTWRRVRPSVATRMRNRTPVRRQDRGFDSRRPHAREGIDVSKADLFSEIVLAEDQLFVTEIQFASEQAASTFQSAAVELLATDENYRRWLRVGRGGRPLRIEQALWISDATPKPWPSGSGNHQSSFSVTLTSDLIARNPRLSFLTHLDGKSLVELADLESALALPVKVDDRASKLETRVVHGFNTAAVARRSPALAIKRGSALRVTATGDSEEAVKKLFETLADLEAAGKGLGERTHEGFGRFALNHPAHTLAPTPVQAGDEAPEAPKTEGRATREAEVAVGQRAKRENVIEQVLQAAEEWKLAKLIEKNAVEFPGRSQWQSLRHDVEALAISAESTATEPSAAMQTINRILVELSSRSATLSGRMWACKVSGKELHAAIKDRCRTLKTAFERQIFLIYLCRWVVAQLDHRTRESRREQGGKR